MSSFVFLSITDDSKRTRLANLTERALQVKLLTALGHDIGAGLPKDTIVLKSDSLVVGGVHILIYAGGWPSDSTRDLRHLRHPRSTLSQNDVAIFVPQSNPVRTSKVKTAVVRWADACRLNPSSPNN